MYEYIYQLPPGGFDHEPHAVQTRVLDNARMLRLEFADRRTAITCDTLKTLTQPTLIMRGEKTQAYYALIISQTNGCNLKSKIQVCENTLCGGKNRARF
jgi:hypothetical protein